MSPLLPNIRKQSTWFLPYNISGLFFLLGPLEFQLHLTVLTENTIQVTKGPLSPYKVNINLLQKIP